LIEEDWLTGWRQLELELSCAASSVARVDDIVVNSEFVLDCSSTIESEMSSLVNWVESVGSSGSWFSSSVVNIVRKVVVAELEMLSAELDEVELVVELVAAVLDTDETVMATCSCLVNRASISR
jgi:hypothetical protein